ncbi:MAG TPA: hypothetical protein DIW51_17060 [Rhodospirillaceae bacterium]|nr:hypothetical protein [Rhodospirillaceae bacterium]HCS71670.1 hypothetical protein [Rhodospirillaceae bacterium]
MPAALALALGLMPLPTAAAVTGEGGVEFILPAPADHNGPEVTAQPVAEVEQQELMAPAASADSKVPVVMAVIDADTAFWRQADASNDPEKVKVYLLTYPRGRHVAKAKVRFRELLSGLSVRLAPSPLPRPARPGRLSNGPPPILHPARPARFFNGPPPISRRHPAL